MIIWDSYSELLPKFINSCSAVIIIVPLYIFIFHATDQFTLHLADSQLDDPHGNVAYTLKDISQ